MEAKIMKRSGNIIKSTLQQQFTGNIQILDSWYWVPTRDEVQRFLKESFIDQYQYVAQAYDCDDFALTLMAYARQERHKKMHLKQIPASQYYSWPLGMVCGTRQSGNGLVAHAFNVCVTSDADVVYIEPQTDRLRTSTKYKIYFCMV
jgi:hypothetical protein